MTQCIGGSRAQHSKGTETAMKPERYVWNMTFMSSFLFAMFRVMPAVPLIPCHCLFERTEEGIDSEESTFSLANGRTEVDFYGNRSFK